MPNLIWSDLLKPYSSPHQSTPPASPHQFTPPTSPHQSTPPASPHQSTPPPSPHQSKPPASPHQSTPPASPHQSTPHEGLDKGNEDKRSDSELNHEALHEQLYSPHLLRLWRTGACELVYKAEEDDEELDVSSHSFHINFKGTFLIFCTGKDIAFSEGWICPE